MAVSTPLTTVSIVTRFAKGGSETRVVDMIRALPDAEHHVIVGRASDPTAVEKRLGRRASIEWCTSLGRAPDPVRDLVALGDLRRRLRRLRPDLVLLHQSKASILGRIAAAGTDASVVVSASMANFGDGYSKIESLLFSRAERWTSFLVDHFTVVGHDLARKLAANGVPPSKLSVVRSSLELGPYLEPLAGAPGPTHEVEIAYVGSLEPRKGVHLLPDIGRELARAINEPVVLTVCGDGPLRSTLESAAQHSDPDLVRYRILGHIPDVSPVIRRADLVVLPSSAEGIPQVLVQAAMAGTPFVAFAVDGVAELLGAGAHGRAVAKIGDIGGFVDAAAELVLQGRSGRCTARHLPATLRSCASEWSADSVQERYRWLFAQVVGDPNVPRISCPTGERQRVDH